MENNNINQAILKEKFPKYLESILDESMLDIFDTFHHYSSANEDFYMESNIESTMNTTGVSSSQIPQVSMYTRFDDFEAGYEKDSYDSKILSTMHHEDNKIKKVYLKDLLKIDFSFIKFEEFHKNSLISPKKKFLNKANKSIIPKKKIFNQEEEETFKFKSQNYKILILSNDYNFNYKALEPYIKNCIKYEDTSNDINLIDKETNKEIHLRKINFRDSLHEKKLIGAIEINDMVKRANILIQPRYNEFLGTMLTIMKFFTFLKKLHDRAVNKKRQLENTMNNNSIESDEKENSSKNKTSTKEEEKKLIKKNNEIVTLKNLNELFYSENEDEVNQSESNLSDKRENASTRSNKNKSVIEDMKRKIEEMERQQKEHLHNNLKEKMRNLIFNEDDSVDYYNNEDNSNEEGDPNNDTINGGNTSMKRDINTSAARFKRRNNIRISSQDNEPKEPVKEFVPQHQTKFAMGLKKYIQHQIEHKKKLQSA